MTSKNANKEILMVAAEASSALYAQRILEKLKSAVPEVKTYGVGNSEMVDLGFEALGRSEKMAVVGVQEILGKFGYIRSVLKGLVDRAKKSPPALALLMDFPDFNFLLAKRLKKLGVPIVYYISPQIWVWRKGRVKFIKRFVDKMLVVFPFETQFYSKHGIDVQFVGHPLLDELSEQTQSEKFRTEQRQRVGISSKDIVLGIMPGSRSGEIGHHLSLQIEVAEKLCEQHNNLRVVLLAAPGVDLARLRAQVPSNELDLIFLQRDPFEMLPVVDLVLCASGTATLVTGLMQKPMIIMYKMNKMTVWFGRRIIKMPKFFGMVNLIFDREVAPEYFQEQATVENLVPALDRLISDPELLQQKTKELAQLSDKLGRSGATDQVVEVLQEYLQ